MERSSEGVRCGWRPARVAAVVAMAMTSLGQLLEAQALTNRLGLDSLQLSAMGLDVGTIRPSQTEPASVFGISADYGRLSRTVRLRFEGGYWESRLTDEVVRTFTDSLRRIISDPSNDDAVRYSRVSLYDVTMGVSARYVPLQSAVLQPFAGLGVGVHIINAEGPLIDGTFVERLLDNISTGLFIESGLMFRLLPRIGVDARVRGDLVNGFRALSVRVGGAYYFGPLRRTDP